MLSTYFQLQEHQDVPCGVRVAVPRFSVLTCVGEIASAVEDLVHASGCARLPGSRPSVESRRLGHHVPELRPGDMAHLRRPAFPHRAEECPLGPAQLGRHGALHCINAAVYCGGATGKEHSVLWVCRVRAKRPWCRGSRETSLTTPFARPSEPLSRRTWCVLSLHA